MAEERAPVRAAVKGPAGPGRNTGLPSYPAAAITFRGRRPDQPWSAAGGLFLLDSRQAGAKLKVCSPTQEVPPAGRRKPGRCRRAAMLPSAPAAIITPMAMELSGVVVRADEWSETCSTAIDSVSGYVVVVISVLESRALLVVSAYLAHVGGPTAVSHLRSSPSGPSRFRQRIIERMPGQTHARACLLDHAAELRDALDELLADEEVTVEVSEEALARAAGVWRAAQP